MNNIFLPDEKVVTESNDNKVILTNMRLIITNKSYSVNLFLEDISSIETFYYGDLLNMLGVMLSAIILELVFLNVDNFFIFLMILFSSCVMIILFWWLLHRSIISITPYGGKKINIMVSQKAFYKIPEFTYQIQLQKNIRLNNGGESKGGNVSK